jgi:hypothetical protein
MNDLEAREWPRQYNNTIMRVKLEPKGSWQTVLLRAAATVSGPDISCVMVPVAGKEFATLLSKVEIDTTFPKAGYFSYGKGAYFFERAPNRQWRRGMCGDNVWIFCPWAGLVPSMSMSLIQEFAIPAALQHDLMGRRLQIDVKLADNLYNRTFSTLEEAQEQIRRGKVLAAPIDYNMAVSAAPDRPEFLLWLGAMPVAEVSKLSIRPFNKLFRQEIVDFFTRQGRLDVNIN